MNAMADIQAPQARESFLEMEFRHARERAALVEQIKIEAYDAGLLDRDKPGTRGSTSILVQVTNRVARDYGLSTKDLTGPRRHKVLQEPRRIIWTELHGRGYSMDQIATFFKRDYSSIHHGIAKLKKMAERKSKAE